MKERGGAGGEEDTHAEEGQVEEEEAAAEEEEAAAGGEGVASLQGSVRRELGRGCELRSRSSEMW